MGKYLHVPNNRSKISNNYLPVSKQGLAGTIYLLVTLQEIPWVGENCTNHHVLRRELQFREGNCGEEPVVSLVMTKRLEQSRWLYPWRPLVESVHANGKLKLFLHMFRTLRRTDFFIKEKCEVSRCLRLNRWIRHGKNRVCSMDEVRNVYVMEVHHLFGKRDRNLERKDSIKAELTEMRTLIE